MIQKKILLVLYRNEKYFIFFHNQGHLYRIAEMATPKTMRIPRIYYCAPFEPHQVFLIEGEAARHLTLVLRLSCETHIILFNGDGFDYVAKITTVNHSKKNHLSIEVNILEKKLPGTKPLLSIHLFQAISKPEKLEWVVQKSVELGVSEITPIITDHCSIKSHVIKLERLKKIMLSACEQCGRAEIPQLNPVITFMQVLENLHTHFQKSSNLFFVPGGEENIKKIIKPQQNINIFIGPEGGFSEDEIHKAKDKNFSMIQLGQRILRTETAPLCALSIVQALWGDFG